MDPTLLVWIASVAGAALFAAGGFLLARARAPEGPTADELASLRLSVLQLESAAAAKDAALAEVQLRREHGEVETRRRAERLELERRTLAQELTHEQHQRHEALRAGDEARAALEREIAAAAGLRHDLAVAVEVQENHRRASAALRAENDALRAGNERLRKEHDAHQAELSAARADADGLRRQLAALDDTAVPALASSPPSGDVAAPGTAGQIFQRLVDGAGEGIDTAVVADELGLVVASRGDHSDALAAFGAYLAHAGARAGEVLPLRDALTVTVQDAARRIVTVRPVASPHSELMLVTLGHGKGHAHSRRGAE